MQLVKMKRDHRVACCFELGTLLLWRNLAGKAIIHRRGNGRDILSEYMKKQVEHTNVIQNVLEYSEHH